MEVAVGSPSAVEQLGHDALDSSRREDEVRLGATAFY
jgi:hypothetical protein